MSLHTNNVLGKYRRLLSKIILTVLIGAQSLLVNAAEETEVESVTSFSGGMNLDGLMQVLTALISVILIIFLISMLMKKFNMVPGGNSSLIKIVSGLALNNKDRLLLVQVGDEQVLLGITQGKISKLHQMQNIVIDEAVNEDTSNEKNTFSKLLASVNSGKKS